MSDEPQEPGYEEQQARYQQQLELWKAETAQRQKYFDDLWEGEVDNRKTYDKLLIVLSGGALGVTLSLLNEMPEAVSVGWLVLAWFLWTFSLTVSLVSHACGIKACRRALVQFSEGTLTAANIGEPWTRWTLRLPFWSGLLFILGTFSTGVFVLRNLLP